MADAYMKVKDNGASGLELVRENAANTEKTLGVDDLKKAVFADENFAPEWRKGAWSNAGALNTTGSYISTKSFQNAGKMVVRVAAGYLLMVGSWRNETAGTSASFVENLVGSYTSMADVREFAFYGDPDYWYRVGIKAADGSTLDTSASENVEIVRVVDKVDDRVTKETYNSGMAGKINLPTIGHGTVGQVLKSSGGALPVWADDEPISGDAITEAVDEWLENNPQAFLSVEDGSITEAKFASSALRYVTPEMFGAAADGVTADDEAIQDAIDYAIAHGGIVDGRGKTYAIDGSITAPWSTSSAVYHGPYIYGSVTVQNMNIFVLAGSPAGTRGLSMKCASGQRIIVENVNVDGNRENQSHTPGVDVPDGQMHGFTVGTPDQYQSEGGSGSIIIRGCTVKDCYTDGMILAATDFEALRVEDCVIEGAGRNGITDNSVNGVVSGCLFRNNGMRTAPRAQYECEPEYILEMKTRVLENCIFVADYDYIDDIVFLLKREKVTEGTSDSIEHLVISNCICKMLAVQSQTLTVPSVFKHITIKGVTAESVRFAPANSAIAENRHMEIIDSSIGGINVQVGSVTVSRCRITGTLSLGVDRLIMTDNAVEIGAAATFRPSAVSAVIDGNVFKNYILNHDGVTNFLGENLFT